MSRHPTSTSKGRFVGGHQKARQEPRDFRYVYPSDICVRPLFETTTNDVK